MQHHTQSVPHPHRLQDWQQNGPVRISHPGVLSESGFLLKCYFLTALEGFIIVLFPQGNKELKSPKSTVGDIPTGGTRNIKNMWEKGNISSSSESPAPTAKVSTREGERETNDWTSAFARMWQASEGAWLDGSAVGKQSLQRRSRTLLLHRSRNLSPHRHLQNQQWALITCAFSNSSFMFVIHRIVCFFI